MKKNLILFLLLFSTQIFAQKSQQFTYDDSAIFETELGKYLKEKNKETGSVLAYSFITEFNKLSSQEQTLIIDVLNIAKASSLNTYKSIEHIMRSIILMTSVEIESSSSLSDWLSSYKNYISDKKIRFAVKEDYVESNYNLLRNFYLNPLSNSLNWQVEAPINYRDENGKIQYFFNDAFLTASKGSDKLEIYNANVSFKPSELLIKVEEAKIIWDKEKFSSDSLFAIAKNFKISPKEAKFEADSVVLTSKYYINDRVLGKLKYVAESYKSKTKNYPEFKSYSENLYYKNVLPDVNFEGSLMVKRNTFFGTGGEYNRGLLIFTRKNQPALNLRSNSIIFSDFGVYSPSSDVSIRIDSDSIYHADVAFTYNKSDEKLLIGKNNSKMTEAAYSNTFSELDMYLKSVSWKRGEDFIYFNTESHVNIPLVSTRYYEREIFKKFKGTNEYNPLLKLRDMYDFYDGMEYFPVELIATYMRMPKQYATHMMMELATMGYVYIELDHDRVKFSEKFLNLVDAHRRRIDFDVITFQSKENVSNYGSVNLKNGEVLVLGIDRINVSNQKRVYLYPTDTVIVKENLNFEFNGDISVGNYEFHGTGYNFNYDDFKIIMDGNQQMEFYVPSWRMDRNGKYYYAKVRNPIDSLRGELFIDDPTNKSGRFNLIQYPIFNNTKDAYVFYDMKEIKNGVYSRKDLFVKLHPFELDSLNAVNSRSVSFEGVISTNGIFPDFEHSVRVQDDYSLGFVYDTEIEGLPLYKQGVYKDEISMDMRGLRGRGRIAHLSSEMESMNIEFYNDSLKSVVSKFKIDKIKTADLDMPSVYADSVYAFWKPKSDSLTIALLHKPFSMYDNILTNKGELTISDKKLTGDGHIVFETAEIASDHYLYTSDYFESNQLNFDLREDMNSPFEFGIDNAYAKVDLTQRKGQFLLQEENASVEFVANKYRAFIDNIVWNIDDKTIDLTSTNEEQIPWFISLDPKQDSLRFQSKIANYSLLSDEIDAFEIKGIEVADAIIYPDSLKVTIMENGWMEGMINAEVKIGIGKNEHTLEKANIQIESSNYFHGDTEYFYEDIDRIKHPILLDNFYVDKETKMSIAKGSLISDEDFMLNPYFSFNGEVEVSGESRFLKFKGFSGIQNYCDNIETGQVPIYDYVDPHNVRVQIDNFENNSRYSFIYNGIYSRNKSYSAAFLSTDKNLKAVDFISAKGKISYNEPEACYVIGGDTIKGVKENEVRFYNDECRLGAKGDLKFYNPDQLIELKGYGDIDYDMNSEEMKAEVVLGISFPFNDDVMYAILKDLELAASLDVIEEESDLQKRAFSNILKKPYGGDNIGGIRFGRDIPDELKFNILLTDLSLRWDEVDSKFLSDNKIAIHSFDGESVNKVFNGRVEIKKNKDGDEYTIYFISQSGKYYYFRYKNNVVDFYTNQRLIMEMFDEIEEEDRNVEKNGIQYRFKKASRLKVTTFQKKYT